MTLHPVVLCGGSGTRLWPSSRKAYPKQFAPLRGDETLYQATLKRFSGEDFAAPLIMTAEDFRFMVDNALIGTDFDSCCHNWATQGLNYYVCAKLHWNPRLDVDA